MLEAVGSSASRDPATVHCSEFGTLTIVNNEVNFNYTHSQCILKHG